MEEAYGVKLFLRSSFIRRPEYGLGDFLGSRRDRLNDLFDRPARGFLFLRHGRGSSGLVSLSGPITKACGKEIILTKCNGKNQTGKGLFFRLRHSPCQAPAASRTSCQCFCRKTTVYCCRQTACSCCRSSAPPALAARILLCRPRTCAGRQTRISTACCLKHASYFVVQLHAPVFVKPQDAVLRKPDTG